ncbi:dentin sialophosphoprotein [Perilla frutescens var. hirtella]|nr:dentin sialophosphoprotein [Perilla frutescens var. hirtella]
MTATREEEMAAMRREMEALRTLLQQQQRAPPAVPPPIQEAMELLERMAASSAQGPSQRNSIKRMKNSLAPMEKVAAVQDKVGAMNYCCEPRWAFIIFVFQSKSKTDMMDVFLSLESWGGLIWIASRMLGGKVEYIEQTPSNLIAAINIMDFFFKTEVGIVFYWIWKHLISPYETSGDEPAVSKHLEMMEGSIRSYDMPVFSYFNSPAYSHPSNGSSYLMVPGNSFHLTPSGVKYGIQQFKPVTTGSPTRFENFTSPAGYAINTPGVVASTAGHDDSSRLKYKQSLYFPNPQAETSEWMNPRDVPSLQSSYYNMFGQTPHSTTYLSSHNCHASFNAAAAAAQLM